MLTSKINISSTSVADVLSRDRLASFIGRPLGAAHTVFRTRMTFSRRVIVMRANNRPLDRSSDNKRRDRSCGVLFSLVNCIAGQTNPLKRTHDHLSPSTAFCHFILPHDGFHDSPQRCVASTLPILYDDDLPDIPRMSEYLLYKLADGCP